MTELDLAGFAYLVAAVCFILSLKGLSHPQTARRGNIFGMVGMVVAIVTTLSLPSILSLGWIITGILLGGTVGTFIALRIGMTALPQLVAAFHSLVGLAAVFVAAAAFSTPENYHIGTKGDINIASLIEMTLGTVIGAITFTGSVVAFGKLQGIIGSKPLIFSNQHLLNAGLGIFLVILTILFCTYQTPFLFWSIVLLGFIIGFLLVLPIGGADMPVVVSMLNSYSGWAACGIGFTLANTTLIITGALVGASGAILSYIMCKGMNRSIFNVILGGFGNTDTEAAGSNAGDDRPIHTGSAEDAGFLMQNAERIIIVPGYGMAVAQAQHALREIGDLLKKDGISVRYAIHPVAGRMPGHMNVLLAEADVPYDDVFELEDINRDFSETDVAFVIGANDVTNPAAKSDKSSPIYGMPILDVEKAQRVLFVKRSMNAGYAGVQNELFYRDNTLMLFGDARDVCDKIIKSLEK